MGAGFATASGFGEGRDRAPTTRRHEAATGQDEAASGRTRSRRIDLRNSDDWRMTCGDNGAVRVLPSDVLVRRVGFRDGTDAELAAMHQVESEVEAERREPQPLESYVAFARNLPSRFGDHTWLAETVDGRPVATAACWSNTAGDERVMECDLFVLRDRRRQGLGTHLLGSICEVTESEGRSLLVWSTFDTVPAGEAFARRLGARVARVNRTSEAQLGDVDWTMVASWMREGSVRAPGYYLEMVDGVYPPERYGDAVILHHIMQSAPRDDLDVDDVILSEDDIAEHDRALAEAGRRRWTVFVRDPSGVCVGGTEVTFEPWDPSTVLQQDTGIDPRHRGLGLAKWAKAAMLARIRSEHPQAQRVCTGNALSNAPMLAINDALGFKVIHTSTEWQADAVAARHTLA
jgi:mycothiol synthase